MHAAPFSKENVPSSCVYSAQGNLVCQKMANSDPVVPMVPYSCSSKPQVMENYMDLNLASMKNKAMGVLGMQQEKYEDNSFEIMMKQAEDALKNIRPKEKYTNGGEFEKMMEELQKMQTKQPKEGYMDFNIGGFVQKLRGDKEKYTEKGFVGMETKTDGESFHSPVETALNMSYSVSPWPF